MKKYRANRMFISPKITEVEVEKETDKSVWIKGRREAKRSEWQNYFDTWEEARDFLIALAESDYEAKEKAVIRAGEILQKIEQMGKIENGQA